MKTFDELYIGDQLHLCVEVFRAMAATRAQNIHRAAEVRDETPDELWRKVCDEICIDECEPWSGYPHKLLPADSRFWTRLAERDGDDVRRRVQGLHGLMLACLAPSSRS